MGIEHGCDHPGNLDYRNALCWGNFGKCDRPSNIGSEFACPASSSINVVASCVCASPCCSIRRAPHLYRPPNQFGNENKMSMVHERSSSLESIKSNTWHIDEDRMTYPAFWLSLLVKSLPDEIFWPELDVWSVNQRRFVEERRNWMRYARVHPILGEPSPHTPSVPLQPRTAGRAPHPPSYSKRP